MDISVIFATYNRDDILLKTINSFCRLKTDGIAWEIIVVDNYGSESTKTLVNSFYGKLPITYLVEERKGKNNALNQAIDHATGDIFVFTDDDIIADENWLQEIWNGTERWPDISIFGGRILPDFPAGMKSPMPESHSFFNGAYVVADWNNGEELYRPQRVWGPNMVVRSSVFHKGWRFNPNIGPCGKNYVMGSETELISRLEQTGMEAVYLPKALVHHQIRPEQLNLNWLYGRAYRTGRFQAQLPGLPDVPYLFSAPRYLYKKILMCAIDRIRFCCNRIKRIDSGINFWILLGNFYQFRVMYKQQRLLHEK